ncbi:CocE/NonD family hydrolase [Steroidobacter flavus]|uniref:CocE/NonD family hydrolase n=1 Tax=Steroidobacter flavus TaxID=1842136 RepID=A0ABV8T0M1_9GAMM
MIRRCMLTIVLAGCALLSLSAQVYAAADWMRPQFDVRIPMRDGVELSTDLWMPAKEGKYPVILMRTPYLKTETEWLMAPELGELFSKHGYVLAVQDTRGRGDSDGKFGYLFVEGDDGFDSIAWLASQPWSNGKVATMGPSYLGAVQWLTAARRPPQLKCMVSTSAIGRPFDELPYVGGAFRMDWAVHWLNRTAAKVAQFDSDAAKLDMDRIDAHRPLLTMDDAYGRHMPMYRDFMQHSTMDDYWKRIYLTPEDFATIDLPVLHITGWFDSAIPGSMFYWRGMAEHSPAKNRQYLLAGPWTHRHTTTGGVTKVGELNFPESSIVDFRELHLKFFDHCLKGGAPTFDFPRTRIYDTGTNQWRDLDGIPHSKGKLQRLYLSGRTLQWRKPGNEKPDSYVFDPLNPTPAFVEGYHYAIDYRHIEKRADVLTYSSEVLTRPVTATGPVFMNLFAATDARDTDFVARLIDVWPDGRAVKVGAMPAGVLRARYRNGYEREQLLDSSAPQEYRIELFDIAHTFVPGHRIRIEVMSGAVPYIYPNSNTGNPVATDIDSRPAKQTIYHDRERPSNVELWAE